MRVDVFRCALQLLLLRRRRQQAVAKRQEGIPLAPAEREHAETLHVRAADMVVDAGQQFHFLGAVAAEQGIVDDEDVPERLARQRRDVFWMMAVPKSNVNLRQWMAQEFRKR